MTYSMKIVDKFADDVETFEIGFREEARLHKPIVLVVKDAEPLFQLACYTKYDDYYFMGSDKPIIWKGNVVIGVGERAFIFSLSGNAGNYIDLDSYFSDFHTTPEIVLVTSGENLHAINPSGQLLWTTKYLGIDGVVVDEVKDNKIFGQGELDPPDGWETFILDLDTGVRQ